MKTAASFPSLHILLIQKSNGKVWDEGGGGDSLRLIHTAGESSPINLFNRVQGTKPFDGIHDHEGVAFMSMQL